MILLKYYSIGQFAEAIGKTTKTLRNCDKAGILKLARVEKIVILYKDRLIRFGYELIETVCDKFGTAIEIIDNTEQRR